MFHTKEQIIAKTLYESQEEVKRLQSELEAAREERDELHVESLESCSCKFDEVTREIKQECLVHSRLRGEVERYKALFVELTNCEYYGEDGEIQGVYCPNSLLDKLQTDKEVME